MIISCTAEQCNEKRSVILRGELLSAFLVTMPHRLCLSVTGWALPCKMYSSPICPIYRQLLDFPVSHLLDFQALGIPKVLTVIILPMETKGHCQQPGPTGVPSLRYRKRKNFTQVNSLQTREMKPPEETESVLPKGKETHLYKVPAPSLIDPFLHK